jgi:hypothetical protein
MTNLSGESFQFCWNGTCVCWSRVGLVFNARAIAWQFHCRLFLRTWMSGLTPNPQGGGPRLCHTLAIFYSHSHSKNVWWAFIMDTFCLEPVPGVPRVLNANAGFYRFEWKWLGIRGMEFRRYLFRSCEFRRIAFCFKFSISCPGT